MVFVKPSLWWRAKPRTISIQGNLDNTRIWWSSHPLGNSVATHWFTASTGAAEPPRTVSAWWYFHWILAWGLWFALCCRPSSQIIWNWKPCRPFTHKFKLKQLRNNRAYTYLDTDYGKDGRKKGSECFGFSGNVTPENGNLGYNFSVSKIPFRSQGLVDVFGAKDLGIQCGHGQRTWTTR